MKRLSFVFCLLSLSLSSKCEEWYSPDAAWKSEGAGAVTIWTGNPPKEKSFNVDSEGNMSEGDLEEWEELVGSYDKNAVMKTALSAAMKAAQAEAMVKNMSIKLNNSVVEVTESGSTARKNVSVKYVNGSGVSSSTLSSVDIKKYYVKKDNDGILSLAEGDKEGEPWVSGTLVDGNTLELYADKKLTRTRIKGWKDKESMATELSDVLKKERGDAMSSWDVVVRKGKDGNLEYMNIGYGLGTPDWVTNELVYATNVCHSLVVMTNVVWATNWTDAVNTITKNETTNIVNVVTNLVQNYQNITTQVHKVEVFTNWYEMVQWTTNVTVNVISNHQSFLNITTNMIHHENFVTNAVTLYSSITNFHEFFTFHTNTFYHENFVTNMIHHERTIEDFVTNNIHAVNYWCTNEYHIVTNGINVVTNTMQVVTNYITTTRALLGLPEIEWNPQDPEYDPHEDPYNPISDKNPINDPDWKDDPNSPFYDSAIGELERQMDDVTNKLVSASNELHKISGGYNWVTNNFDDITNSINVLKSMKNDVKIYNAISNGTYVSMWLDHKSIGTNESGLAEMKGFGENPTHTYPVKRYYSDGTAYILWTPMPRLDSQYAPTSGDGLIDKGMSFSSIENATSSGTMGTTNVLSLYGFSSTEKGQIPFVNIWGTGTESMRKLAWANASSNQFEITHVGTYGEEESHDINIKGFETALVGFVPYKKSKDDGGYEIAWTNVVSGAITVASETSPTPIAASNIVFKAAADTNCEFDITQTNGTAVISVHVYWK